MQQLKQLKRKKSLQIKEGMLIKWPRLDKPGKFNVAKTIKNIGAKQAYNTKNGITAFVDYGVLYATPYDSIAILEANGFKKADLLHVPFSCGDLPEGKDRKLWEQLVAEAKMSHHS